MAKGSEKWVEKERDCLSCKKTLTTTAKGLKAHFRVCAKPGAQA